jgi:hypothetical protein
MLPINFGSFCQAASEETNWFKNGPTRNKNCLWWPRLLTDRHQLSNLYSGHSKDGSYQVFVHLAKRFQRRRLKFENVTDDNGLTPSDDKS